MVKNPKRRVPRLPALGTTGVKKNTAQVAPQLPPSKWYVEDMAANSAGENSEANVFRFMEAYPLQTLEYSKREQR